MKHCVKYLVIIMLLIVLTSCETASDESADKRASEKPNIIVILADDMGYSDIGCFGAEIKTLVLDRLAEEGVRMSQFYNGARCCPSRASLLTGQYPHAAGMGSMADQNITIPSYQGYLNNESITIAEALKSAGYETFMSGKWHVGEEKEYWPHERGFDRVYSSIRGAGSYFDGLPYRSEDWLYGRDIVFAEDSMEVEREAGEYATDLYTRKAKEFIRGGSEKPFFLYLAYTAPHWPLHALPEDIAKYEGIYDVGWDAVREQRYQRLIELGLIEPDLELAERNPGVSAWDELELDVKKDLARRMQVFAAMVDRMDQQIGSLLEVLEERDELQNTVIFFMSDNGGARPLDVGYLHPRYDRNAPIGSPESFVGYGPGWATASNTPFRRYKAEVHEGGIATPFIAWYPKRFKQGSISHEQGHIIDLLPTCLELAGADYPQKYNGNFIKPLPGVSLLSALQGESLERGTPLCFEHHANFAIRDGKWKLVKLRDGDWELFDMEKDRTEMHNLIDSADPELIADLLFKYDQWKKEVGVFPQDVVHNRTIIDQDK